jgi:hypothetical protein
MSRSSSSTTSTMLRVQLLRHVARLVAWLIVDYFAFAVRPGASARRAARRRLLQLRRASGCFGTSRGSSSTTSTTPRVRVPRHVARLVVDYFDYAVHPVASAHRAARRVARSAARRRVLRLRRASGYLGTSRGLSRDSSSTISTTPRVRLLRHVAWHVTPLVVNYFALRRLVVDYFAYVARPGASARRAARRRLLRLRRASGCFSTLRGSSRGSSSTTSPPPHIRVPRHVARLVVRLVVN